MATMDFLDSLGLKANNFMDLGGQARAEKISDGFSLLNEDNSVGAIFVNLFGG